uniref:Uncharacterized protein n=1 Tax=Magallana gigas TaxID=29159 RepID=A0A8W8NXZ4_MAGGI
MGTLQFCLSMCVVILFCSCGDTLNTTTVRNGKSTIGPVFVTVAEKPNQSDQRQVLIKFSGPPDTVLTLNARKRNKVQDSDGKFVSEVDLEQPMNFTIRLSSKATSEWLWITIFQDIGYYEIYPTCSLDITSSDNREITIYTIVVSDCHEKPEGDVVRRFLKNGKRIYSTDYLTMEETHESRQESVTTVSFNRSRMMNDNVELSLWFSLYYISQENRTPEIYQEFTIFDESNLISPSPNS